LCDKAENPSLIPKPPPKGSRNNNFLEFAPRFWSDWIDLMEPNRKRSKNYAEDLASEDRPKVT